MEAMYFNNRTASLKLKLVLTTLLAVYAACDVQKAFAETTKVLALGASNTNGRGVSTSEAWPAQLERMLRAKGYDVTVSVNAINGDTSSGVLSRTSSIPSGTRVVIFDTGGDNDRKRGGSETSINANKAQIISAIRAHGAKPLQAQYQSILGPMNTGSSAYQGDGHHLTPASHARIAASLMPGVAAAIKK